MTDVTNIRQAILSTPLETSNFGHAPNEENLYLPASHTKALRLDSYLVVGSRGVGKSFWTAALSSNELRSLIGTTIKELDHTDVWIGFSEKSKIDQYPSAPTFSKLLQDNNGEAYDIWGAVVLRWIANLLDYAIPSGSWQETVNWIKKDPECIARLMENANEKLSQEKRSGLIVFDALDRSSNDWRTMDQIVRDLLRIALWLKPYSHLHAKIFLRSDQFERTVTNFPDASKLLATKADIAWMRHDLHGLLWQQLINAPDEHGEVLRALYEREIGDIPIKHKNVWQIPVGMKKESHLRVLFQALAGPWMGRDRRRGVPYTWAVGHLADGLGQTSPRSFLAAIMQATEDSIQRYPQHEYALHYESIKRGIQKASDIRVAEVAEDYPWITDVLSVLSGMNVPCDKDNILDRWNVAFPNGPNGISSDKLPAQHADRGWQGIEEDLVRLGLIEFKKDGRMDMPDLYRVGFKLGRKGGVKPNH